MAIDHTEVSNSGLPLYARIETVQVMDRFANGTFPNWHAKVYEHGKHVATYCNPLKSHAEQMARGRYAPVEEEYPCGLFKGPEDY